MATSMTGNQGMRNPASSATGQSLTGGNIIPKGYKQGQMQQFTPEQMQLFQSLFGQVGPDSYLSKLARGDEGTFSQIEAPALKQFGELQGQIGSRFAGMGMGAQKGSGFRNTLNQATSDFATQLQSQRQQLQRQAIQDMFGMSQQLLEQRPYEQFLIEKQKKQSGFSKAAGIGLPILGGVAGGIFGGPAGAAAGATLGSNIASGFTGGPQASYEGIGSLPTKWKS